MALSSMIRLASFPMLPLAIRALGSPRSFHGAIATAVNVHNRTIFSPKSCFQSHSYSSARSGAKKVVDDNIIRFINSEIKTVNPVHEIPKGFPFAIESNSDDGTILLTRQEADERIKVEVDMTALEDSVPDEDNSDHKSDSESDDTANDSEDDSCEETNNETNDTDDSCDNSDDSHDDSDNKGKDSRKESKTARSFPMTVSVTKGNGLALEFDVMASADNIAIQCLAIKESTDNVDEYDGPSFWDLDPELKHALHRYIEIRGIKTSTAEYLQKYIMNQNRKEELQWLKKLKRFIKK